MHPQINRYRMLPACLHVDVREAVGVVEVVDVAVLGVVVEHVDVLADGDVLVEGDVDVVSAITLLLMATSTSTYRQPMQTHRRQILITKPDKD